MVTLLRFKSIQLSECLICLELLTFKSHKNSTINLRLVRNVMFILQHCTIYAVELCKFRTDGIPVDDRLCKSDDETLSVRLRGTPNYALAARKAVSEDPLRSVDNQRSAAAPRADGRRREQTAQSRRDAARRKHRQGLTLSFRCLFRLQKKTNGHLRRLYITWAGKRARMEIGRRTTQKRTHGRTDERTYGRTGSTDGRIRTNGQTDE